MHCQHIGKYIYIFILFDQRLKQNFSKRVTYVKKSPKTHRNHLLLQYNYATKIYFKYLTRNLSSYPYH